MDLKDLMLRFAFCFCLLSVCTLPFTAKAQEEGVWVNNIHAVKLHIQGDQLRYPVIRLHSADKLELHFDDLDADVKYYTYSFELFNADWTPAPVSQFDYMKGFSMVRINTYRNASIALTPYTHYMATIPDQNTFPTRAGNYLLKVYLNGDVRKPVFSKRFLVVDHRLTVSGSILQPFNPAVFKTHQKVQFFVNAQPLRPTNVFQQIKVVILQNNRWDLAIQGMQPTFNRQNILEYNTENEGLFSGKREWRWLNLMSLRLQTDRIDSGAYTNKGQTLFMKAEGERNALLYRYYRDANGMYRLANIENNNPYWQGDYATVWFRYLTPQGKPYSNQDLYVFGELTNYQLNDAAKMQFNEEKGYYECPLFLKQGYYDYIYITRDRKTGAVSSLLTEGNAWETENDYTILVYYRPLGGRSDELVGITRVNALSNRPGFNIRDAQRNQ